MILEDKLAILFLNHDTFVLFLSQDGGMWSRCTGTVDKGDGVSLIPESGNCLNLPGPFKLRRLRKGLRGGLYSLRLRKGEYLILSERRGIFKMVLKRRRS